MNEKSEIDLLKFQKSLHSSMYDKEITVWGTLYPHQTYNGKQSICFSCGGGKTTKYSTQCINWSSIRDHLIRLAAHHTEYYASDLMYYLESIQHDLGNGEVKPEGYFFGFRDSGIDPGDFIIQQYKHSNSSNYYRAIWRVMITISQNKDVNMVLHRVEYNPYRKVERNE